MIKLFPESKRPWSDGLPSFDKDYRNSYEIYFGLFGGDDTSGSVSGAPRRTDIRGQDHMLSYITPGEADVLKALGGSGSPGPKGIPAFFDVGEGAGGYGSGDEDDATAGAGDPDGASGGGYGSSSGPDDPGAQAGDTTTSDAETDDPATAGAGSTEAGYSAGPDGQPGTADDTMGTPGGQLGGYQGSTGPEFGGYAGSPYGPNPTAVSYAGPPDMTAEQKAAIAKAFVTNTKGMPISTPNSKGKFGGYLGKENATDKDISGALAALAGIPGTAESKAAGAAAAAAAASGAPVGITSSPSISATEVLGISPVESMARFGVPGYAGMTAQAATTAAAADTAQNTATAPSARASSINASNVLSAVNDLAAQSLASSQGKPGAPSTGIASVAVDSLDRSNPNAMAAAEIDSLLGALSSDVRSGPVSDTQIGIAQAPSVSAAEVLGVAPASTGLTSTGLIGAQGPPGMVSRSAPPGTVDFSLDFPGTQLDSTVTGTGSLANALDFAFDGINSTTAQDIANARAAEAPMSSVSAPASVSAQEVLSGIDRSNPNAMAAAERAASVSAPASNVVSDFSPTPADQLAEVYGIDLDALNAAVDDPNAAMGARGPTATDAKAAIGYDPVTDMPYGLEFATNPQTGAPISTNLAGLTREQAKNQPFSMDVAQFIGSNPYGYEIDPVTGQVIGQVGSPPMGILGNLTRGLQNLFMGPPQNTQDLIERGAYTGMTGQGGDGMTGGDGAGVDSVAQQPTTDPCPEGYALIDGACTPVSPEEEAAFKFGTDTGVKYFDPFTQATQLGGMNPFVLQPYMPGQNPFAQPSQTPASTGIQALSPTGAALGRQV